MKLVGLIEFLRKRLKTMVSFCCAILGGLLLIDSLFVNKEHVHTWVERVPGFWSAFGFLGCGIIILASKWFGHAGIMKREDYYDE